jgi:hypothetical protein
MRVRVCVCVMRRAGPSVEIVGACAVGHEAIALHHRDHVESDVSRTRMHTAHQQSLHHP